jgi:hypothetical protein
VPTHIFVYVCILAHIFVYVYIHTCIHTYIHACMHIDLRRDLAISYDEHDEDATKEWQVYVCVYAYVSSICMYRHICLQIHIRIPLYTHIRTRRGRRQGRAGVLIHVRVRVCVCRWTRVSICKYVCRVRCIIRRIITRVCVYMTYTCVHASMCACMYTYMRFSIHMCSRIKNETEKCCGKQKTGRERLAYAHVCSDRAPHRCPGKITIVIKLSTIKQS